MFFSGWGWQRCSWEVVCEPRGLHARARERHQTRLRLSSGASRGDVFKDRISFLATLYFKSYTRMIIPPIIQKLIDPWVFLFLFLCRPPVSGATARRPLLTPCLLDFLNKKKSYIFSLKRIFTLLNCWCLRHVDLHCTSDTYAAKNIYSLHLRGLVEWGGAVGEVLGDARLLVQQAAGQHGPGLVSILIEGAPNAGNRVC